MLQAIGIVMFGAAVGGALRFLITHYSSEITFHHGFPYGTLAVNILGSFIVGYVLTWSADHSHDRWRLLMATGFCGGLTTFSSFAFETMAYWREGNALMLAANVLLNNTGAFLALLLGIWAHPNGR
jgi:fluoride exporter